MLSANWLLVLIVLVEAFYLTDQCENKTYDKCILTMTGSPMVATPTMPPPTLCPAQKSHPPDYELFPGVGYYKFHTAPTTWPAARKICAREGGHLAIVNSDKETETLKFLFAMNPDFTIIGGMWTTFAWIGIHDLLDEGKFQTIFGDSLNSTGYSRWYSGRPYSTASDNKEDCVLFHRKGDWHDVTCYDKLAFICEDEL